MSMRADPQFDQLSADSLLAIIETCGLGLKAH
jgi:hypothetical protein